MTKTLIFSDMDGTLLDHHTYSFAAAKPTLNKLRLKEIAVIPTTSKTYAEMQSLRHRIGLEGPFIIENGAAIYIPTFFLKHKPSDTTDVDGFWCKSFIADKSHWIHLLEHLDDEFSGQYQQFSKMSVSDIQECTGLDAQSASLAAKRQFGEPVLWLGNDADKSRFIEAIKNKGAYPLEGGRFIHISGNCNKGQALYWLATEYQNQFKVDVNTIALGDGKNDVAMLEAADVAVRIHSPTNPPPEVNNQNLHTSTLTGPEGWSEMLTALLKL